jgi:hypothetical protein
VTLREDGWRPASALRVSLGIKAEASLKLLVLNIQSAHEQIYPNKNAGASLKVLSLPCLNTAVRIFPQQKCCGLMDVTSKKIGVS